MKSLLILFFSITLVVSSNPSCEPGSVLNHLSLCTTPTYIEGCHQYASPNKCHQCQFNYRLNPNAKCQYQPQPEQHCCISYNLKTDKCQQCQIGLFLENGKCINKKSIGCLIQDQKGDCSNCANSYYLQNGKCTKTVQNCAHHLIHQDTLICDRCDPGNTLINNLCLQNTILGCKHETNGVCQDCYDPFDEKQNHCEVPNCKTHNDFGCVSCECGFYLTADRKCNQVSQGCIRYNRGICTDCVHPFQLKGGVCDIQGCLQIDGAGCVRCGDGYQNADLGCKLKNCMLQREGYCEVCQQGYHHKSGVCVQNSTRNTNMA